MKMPPLSRCLCLITDPAYLPEDSFEEKIIEALEGGVDMVQYRHKTASAELALHQAKILRRITGEHHCALLINGNLALAKAVHAEGVQLGRDAPSIMEAKRFLGRESLIGASVHNAEEARQAERSGADFLLLSPLFPPGSKASSPALLPDRFARLCRSLSLPVFALGGIIPENAAIAIQCGAHGLASISGILDASSIRQAAKKMREIAVQDRVS